ncbi:MAG TPA: alkaline phosphatase D family protein [Polyangiaceae bacterium]|nr:alkaline phosphatase D family protein [Polyangiaceae bacterium]
MHPVGRRDALKLAVAAAVSGCSRARHPGDLGDGAWRGSTDVEDPAVAAEVTPPPTTFTLAFGSCNRPSLPQPLWSDVRALAPDTWAWLGDIVYADTDDVTRTRRLYAEQAARADYAALVAQTRVVGAWDDHDFGRNDAGSEYPSRVASQAALLDFLGEPAGSRRRAQLGVYASYVFGDGDRQVKLIMLDGRYHRDPPGAHGDTLGETQWAWLENELASSRARVTVVSSGYQVLPLDHSNEKWGNFPAARTRLLDLVARTHARGVVLLSGDRHFAELSCLRDGPGGYPLFELTSSGLTHAYENADEPNRYRVGSLYPHRNFGVVRVDWSAETLTLEARARGGGVVIGETMTLASLAT